MTSPGLVIPRLDGRERILLAIEHARRSAMVQMFQARHLHDCAIGCEVTLQADDAAGGRERIAHGPHHLLVRD